MFPMSSGPHIINGKMPSPNKKVLFLSDLDGTWLSKVPENRQALDQGILELKDEFSQKGVDLEFGYVTARPPERVVKESLPTPSWTISFNGGRIDKGFGFETDTVGNWQLAKSEPFQPWEELNRASNFSAETAIADAKSVATAQGLPETFVQTVGQVLGNPAADDCKNSAHLCFQFDTISLAEAEKADKNLNQVPDILEPEHFKAPKQIEGIVQSLKAELMSGGASFDFSPLYLFSGKPYVMVDVATPIANKGAAVDFLRNQEGVDADHLIIAGDGGNDISMMRSPKGLDDGRRVIVVGPEAGLREAGSKIQNSIIQDPSMDCSLGVLDGLRKHLNSIAQEK